MNDFIRANINEPQKSNNPGLITYLMVIAHFVQKKSMDILIESQRYQELSLSYEGYISLLAEQNYSPGELAKKLSVTKQACSKMVKELESLGLLARSKNPQDSRSSILFLTEQGQQLVYDGIEVTTEIQQQLAETIGAERLERLIDVLEKLCRGLSIDIPYFRSLELASGEAVDARSARLSLLVPRLSDYFYQYLINDLTEKGFKGLKPNFSQVLGLISSEAGRIQYISSVVGVSKQAIAMTASELEQLGYIVREPDPNDKRQIILRLAPRGHQLLSESTDSVRTLTNVIKEILNPHEYRHLVETMAKLYTQVATHYDTPNALPIKIQQLSESLLKELGIKGARMLAQQLLSMTRDNT